MEIVKAKISDYTVPLTVKIRGMAVSVDTAMKIESEGIKNVRSIISRIQRNSSQRYKTAKAAGGILIWRIA